MWTEKDFVLPMVKLNGTALKFASNGMKNDQEVVLAAFQKIGYKVRENMSLEEMMKVAAARDGEQALQYVGSFEGIKLPHRGKANQYKLLALPSGPTHLLGWRPISF